ncbi:MAG: cupin domain-containing protein [Patescibacteria group bacterium]
MKIVSKDKALHAHKLEGLEVWHYLFDEYEIHYDEQAPNTKQVWHLHNKVHETLFLIEGELEASWKEGPEIKSHILKAGDIAETENSDHVFENKTNKVVKFLIIKQVLVGVNKSEVLKNDKVITENK